MKNFIKRTFFTNLFMEHVLIMLCRLHYFFSKFIPSNTHYPKFTYRIVSRNGITYHLDISDYQEYLIYFDLKEDSSEPFLIHAPKKEGVFIDIGANIGQTSLSLSKKLGTISHTILAFEPFPSTFEKLKANISLNPFASIEIYNEALGNEKKTIEMEMSCPTNSGGYKIAPKNSNIKEDLIRVFQDKLDNFYTLDKPIQFIKIDVEGYEMEVLKGGEQIIRKHMPTMVIELNDMNLKNQNSSAKEVVKLIEGIGYKEVINLETMKTLEDSVLDNCCIDILCKQI
jgi:FkbM family methyltransferase